MTRRTETLGLGFRLLVSYLLYEKLFSEADEDIGDIGDGRVCLAGEN